jgi:hypothetical protein
MNRHSNTGMPDSIPPPTQTTITTVNSTDSDDSSLIEPFPALEYDLAYSPETIIAPKYPNTCEVYRCSLIHPRHASHLKGYQVS